MPSDLTSAEAVAEDTERAPGFEHEKLEGWIPPLASDADVAQALEKAFDYRGDITLTLKSGEAVDAYVFDRHTDPADLAKSYVRVMPKAGGKRTIGYADIAALAFTGRDTAAGKSFETWVKKYHEKKARGETNISIEPEKLD